ncbi:DegT/DnrJ/EryC1/StrS family aminotransferase [bacterium]|nr:MAG: DegT/DnrJ/EryC1/StrS family aminotransferase [bacterium]
MIPILDLTVQYRALKPEIDAVVADVFAHGHFINGPHVHAFEAEIAAYLNVPYAVALNSGTDALHLALRALDIGPGDEVITTPFTFAATTEAIGIVGATPVFADIDPRTFAIDPQQIERLIGPRTKAVLPVHLYGTPAAMEEIMTIAQRHGVAVIEDCAQSIGAKVGVEATGTIGDIGCFSFFPSKNLGAYGDGGMLVTRSERIADRVRALRAHGGAVKYHHDELGVNSRLDEVQAAILRVKLPHLDDWNARRRAIAQRYTEQLQHVPGLDTPSCALASLPVYHQYTVRVDQRDALRRLLSDVGIQTMVYYPTPLHLQPVHAHLGLGPGTFPHAERAAAEVLSLPIYPELDVLDQERVIAAIAMARQATVGV